MTEETYLEITTVKVDNLTKDRYRRLAALRKRSVHSLMIDATEQYLEREEKREAFRQEALRAYEEYMHSGLHLSGDEADAWMAQLEAGLDVAPPECHK
jgi:predicted transcriptional regulator